MTFIDYGTHLNASTKVGRVTNGLAVAAFVTTENYTAFIDFEGKKAFLHLVSDNDVNKYTHTSVKTTDALGDIIQAGIKSL